MSQTLTKKSPRKKFKVLTKEEEKEIILVYEKGGISQRDLANKYEVSKTKVQSLLKQRKESSSKCDFPTGNAFIFIYSICLIVILRTDIFRSFAIRT